MKMDNLEKIKKFLKEEKIIAVYSNPLNIDFPTLTIETTKHTIILTLKTYNFLSLKDYGNSLE